MAARWTDDSFLDYLHAGGVVLPTDPMPEDYRAEVVRIVGFQALAEVVGTLLFSEWISRAPTLQRKIILAAKCQDEMGHAQVLMRVVEDLGRTREAIIEDFLDGRVPLLNVFHYRIESWPELAVASLTQNSAAIAQFQSLVTGSYLPYTRALRKIMREESFHYHQALDLVSTLLADGTAATRATMQAALDKWFPILLAYFGPPDRGTERGEAALKWRVKVDLNDTLRDRWLDKMVPVFTEVGLRLPDENLRRDPETGYWSYTMPDWAEVKRVIKGGGPASAHFKALIQHKHESNRWLREAVPGELAAA